MSMNSDFLTKMESTLETFENESITYLGTAHTQKKNIFNKILKATSPKHN